MNLLAFDCQNPDLRVRLYAFLAISMSSILRDIFTSRCLTECEAKYTQWTE